jgi:hypothetical protein
MGHPDAAYDLTPEAQARLLGWLFARSEKFEGKRKGKSDKLSGEAIFNYWQGRGGKNNE